MLPALALRLRVRVLLALLAAAAVCLLATPAVRKFACKIGAMDMPGESRRVHDHPIPRLGGLALLQPHAGAEQRRHDAQHGHLLHAGRESHRLGSVRQGREILNKNMVINGSPKSGGRSHFVPMLPVTVPV